MRILSQIFHRNYVISVLIKIHGKFAKSTIILTN